MATSVNRHFIDRNDDGSGIDIPIHIRIIISNLSKLSHEIRDEPGPLSGPLWSRVSHVFGLGSTSSVELCRRYGFDPDEELKQPTYCDACVEMVGDYLNHRAEHHHDEA